MMKDRDFEHWLSRLDAEEQNAPDYLDLDAELQRVVERGNEIRRRRATEHSAAIDRYTDIRIASRQSSRKAIAAGMMAAAAAVIAFAIFMLSFLPNRGAQPQYELVSDSFGIEIEFFPDTVDFQVDELKKEVAKRVGDTPARYYKLTVTASLGSRGNADSARLLATARLDAVVTTLVSMGLTRENISDRLVSDGSGGVLVRETVSTPGKIVTLPPPPPTVTASKGASTRNSACAISCNFVRISLRNYTPNTSYMISCAYATQSAPQIFYSYTATTNDLGALDSQTCFYGVSGGTVLALVDGVESNRVKW